MSCKSVLTLAKENARNDQLSAGNVNLISFTEDDTYFYLNDQSESNNEHDAYLQVIGDDDDSQYLHTTGCGLDPNIGYTRIITTVRNNSFFPHQ